MLRLHLQPERGEDQIRRTMIAEATAVKVVANTLTSQVGLLIGTKNQAVDQMTILMIIIRAVDIQRRVDTNIRNPGLNLGPDLDLSHHILRHRRRDVIN